MKGVEYIMECDSKLLEQVKDVVKEYNFISVNTLKLILHKGIVTCNLLIEDLKELGLIEDFDTENGIFKVLI